jgi:hypothetical protein
MDADTVEAAPAVKGNAVRFSVARVEFDKADDAKRTLSARSRQRLQITTWEHFTVGLSGLKLLALVKTEQKSRSPNRTFPE